MKNSCCDVSAGVCEVQNLKSGPYYGPPITQKCWFREAGFSVNKWSLCVCAWLRCECQLLVPFSPHLQPLTLDCLHVVLFMSNKPFFCFLCIFSFFFNLSAFALIAVSPRPKKSDVFYWASSFFQCFHVLFFFWLSLVVVKCAPWFCNFYLLYSKENVKRAFGKQ